MEIRKKKFPPKNTNLHLSLGFKQKKHKLASKRLNTNILVQGLISRVGFQRIRFCNSRIKKKISAHIGQSKKMPIAIAISAMEMKPYENV